MPANGDASSETKNREKLPVRIGTLHRILGRGPREQATMFEEFDEDSGSDSSGSSLPGPDEFMRRARVELARRRSPTRPMTGKERFTAGGVAALMAEGAALKSEPTPNHVRTKSMDSVDGDDEFQPSE